MKGSALAVSCVFALWLAGILQAGVASHLSLGRGGPDFCLVVLASLGLYCDRKGATILGFGAGWIVGALDGTNLTLFVLSRAVAGFLLGWSLALGVQRNLLVAAIAGISVTLIAEFIMIFAGAHRGPLVPYLVGTLVTTMYNGVIAVILFALVSRLTGTRHSDRY